MHAAINALYGSNPQQQKEANDFLVQFSSTNQAWEAALSLLGTGDPQVRPSLHPTRPISVRKPSRTHALPPNATPEPGARVPPSVVPARRAQLVGKRKGAVGGEKLRVFSAKDGHPPNPNPTSSTKSAPASRASVVYQGKQNRAAERRVPVPWPVWATRMLTRPAARAPRPLFFLPQKTPRRFFRPIFYIT